MTHTYSTDSPERRYVPFFIAAAAIGAIFLTSHLLDEYKVILPWWASLPIDTMAFYGAFYELFDRYVWKWGLLRWLKITRIPNLSGQWHGQVDPAETKGVSAGLGAKAEITIRIKQTWTRLTIAGETKLSKSHSLSGSIIVKDERHISYEYVNEPSASAPATMHIHRGTARLFLNDKCTVLEGEYYSGRDRQNVGTIRLTRS